MAEFIAEQSMSDCVDSTMGTYAEYTIETKLPSAYDGLKPLHRRILIVAHESAKKKAAPIKEVTLVGRVMEMHPHGDQSIASAISNMAQPFTHLAPLIYSESNVGSYAGKPPAAARYVEVCESEFAKDLFFGDVNQGMLRLVPQETGDGVEPAFLVPRLPTSLFVPVFGIAIGYQSNTVACNLNDLCELTKEYIRLRSHDMHWETKLPSLVKYLLPDFPTECRLRNKKELLHFYKKGQFSVPMQIDGKMRITSDRIIVETLPTDKNFKSVTMNIGLKTKDKTSFEATNFQQMVNFSGREQGVKKGAFECLLRRGLSPFEVLTELKKELQFTSNWKPERHYVDIDNRNSYFMTEETPWSLMGKWYTARYNVVVGDLKQKLRDMVAEQRKLMALVVVCDHTDEVLKIFKTAKNSEDTIVPLVREFGLTRPQATFLSKLQLAQITAQGKDELLKKLEDIKKDMANLQTKFNKIDELMIESIERFQAKHAALYPRNCICPRYIGTACYKDTGWIMLEDEAEMDTVLRDFPNPEDIEFTLFDQVAGDPRAFGAEEDIDWELPKYLKATSVRKIDDEKYTACICHKGGAMVYEKLVGPSGDVKSTVPVGNVFTAIDKTGHRTIVKVTDKIMRKNISAGATMKDIVYASPVADKECIVIHGSTACPNYLTIERISGEEKLKKLVVGEWKILAVLPVTTMRTIINIPKELRQRCSVRHIVFDHLGDHIKPGEKQGILFGRGPGNLLNNYELKPFRRKSLIMEAVHK